MDKNELKVRTKSFALQVMKVVEILPKGRINDVLAKQLLRSATSVRANYRAVCRGKSLADFISKLRIVEEKTGESIYWINC